MNALTIPKGLSFVLTSAKPLSLVKDSFRIGVPYLFHHDRIAEPKNRALLSEIATTVLGRQVLIEPVLSETPIEPSSA